MNLEGPFPELDDHQYQIFTLKNGITALLVSSKQKDTMTRRATSKMDFEDRRAIVKLLHEASTTSIISSKEGPRQRRSTLITDPGSLRNLFRNSQRNTSRIISDIEVEEEPYVSSQIRGGSKTMSRKFSEDAQIENNYKRTSRRNHNNNNNNYEDQEEDKMSIRSIHSHKSLPKSNSFVKQRSQQRLSFAASSQVNVTGINNGSGCLTHIHRPSNVDLFRPIITDLAACAVCVSIGSFSDPAECQGLAHVVEHMVFMGSEQYPSENDWDTFISSSGGDSNASTESERTCFHFSVPQESFSETLSRFSQFFYKPLLRKESLQRELAAINSEFNDSAGEISFRLAEVASATARKGPFSQFACGNSTTLKSNLLLHENVLNFFSTHYVSTNISIVLYSSDSLNEMKMLCEQYFQNIPISRPTQYSCSIPKFIPTENPFRSVIEEEEEEEEEENRVNKVIGTDGYTLGCMVICDPEGNQPHTLQLSWQLECQRGNWETKPLFYLAEALGYETEGSILSELKSKGWANSVFSSDGTYASCLESNSISTMFSLYILLTDLGLLNYESVIGTVYEYLGMLAREGVQFWFFEELRKCRFASFVFKDTSDPSSLVESLSQRLCVSVSKIPPERVCNGEDLVFKFVPEKIQDVLKLLTPETCRIDLVTRLCGFSSKTTENNPVSPSLTTIQQINKNLFEPLLKGVEIKSEPWYGTKYCVVRVSKNSIKKWKTFMDKDSSSSFAHLPKKNEYISDDFAVKPRLFNFVNVETIVNGKNVKIEAIHPPNFALINTRDENRMWIKIDENKQEELFSLLFKTPILPSLNSSSSFVPVLIESSKNKFLLWHLQNGNFETCRFSLTILFKFGPSILSTPLNSSLLDLLLVCFEDSISEEKYPSSLSGTFLDIKAVEGEKGVRMTFSGFSDTVKLLVERVLPEFLKTAKYGIQKFKNLSLESQLQVIQSRLANDDCPLKETLNGVLRCDDHHSLVKLGSLEKTLDIQTKLDLFAKEAMQNCFIIGLAYGNIQVNEAFDIQEKIEELISINIEKQPESSDDIKKYFYQKKILNVPSFSKLKQQVNNSVGDIFSSPSSVFVAEVPSSSVLVYFQVSLLDDTFEQNQNSRISCQLIAQLLKEPLFNTLRTKWQIAYHAHTAFHECEGSLGITIEVSSHHTSTVDLIEIIDEFFLLFLETILKPMNIIDFNRHVRALELRKLEKDAGPSEEAKRYFDTIVRGLETSKFYWNIDNLDISKMTTLTKSSVLEFFNSYLNPASQERRKLTLLIVGESEIIQNQKREQTTRTVRVGLSGTTGGIEEEDEADEEGEEDYDNLLVEKEESINRLNTPKKKWWLPSSLLKKVAS